MELASVLVSVENLKIDSNYSSYAKKKNALTSLFFISEKLTLIGLKAFNDIFPLSNVHWYSQNKSSKA